MLFIGERDEKRVDAGHLVMCYSVRGGGEEIQRTQRSCGGCGDLGISRGRATGRFSLATQNSRQHGLYLAGGVRVLCELNDRVNVLADRGQTVGKRLFETRVIC